LSTLKPVQKKFYNEIKTKSPGEGSGSATLTKEYLMHVINGIEKVYQKAAEECNEFPVFHNKFKIIDMHGSIVFVSSERDLAKLYQGGMNALNTQTYWFENTLMYQYDYRCPNKFDQLGIIGGTHQIVSEILDVAWEATLTLSGKLGSIFYQE
jgi:hypothetical protein